MSENDSEKLAFAQKVVEKAAKDLEANQGQDKLSLTEAGFALREAKEAIGSSELAIQDAESAKLYAENARDMAEEARNISESARDTAESARNYSDTEKFSLNLINRKLLEANQKAELSLQKAHTAYQLVENALEKAEFARKQALLAEERYKLVIQGSNDGLWDWNIETSEVYWNGHFYRMLGIQNPDEQNTLNLLESVHPDDQDRLKASIQSALSQTEHFEDIFRIRNAAGNYLFCRMRGKTFFENEKAVRMAGTITDITEAKLAEELIQKLKTTAEQANKEKTKVLSFVSHDFKNPLNAISQFIGIIKGDDKGSLSSRQVEFLGYIGEGIQHLHKMVVGILDKTRLEEGQMVSVPQLIHLEELIQQLKPLFKAMALPQGIEVIIESDPTLKAFQCDPAHLRQILINLVSNAIKYNKPNNQVILRFYPSPDGQWLYIEVQDFGIGLSAESISKLFTEYYRVVNMAEINTVEGSGLGLAFIKKLVELNHGEITVDSEINQGSTFKVTLPLVEASP